MSFKPQPLNVTLFILQRNCVNYWTQFKFQSCRIIVYLIQMLQFSDWCSWTRVMTGFKLSSAHSVWVSWLWTMIFPQGPWCLESPCWTVMGGLGCCRMKNMIRWSSGTLMGDRRPLHQWPHSPSVSGFSHMELINFICDIFYSQRSSRERQSSCWLGRRPHFVFSVNTMYI